MCISLQRVVSLEQVTDQCAKLVTWRARTTVTPPLLSFIMFVGRKYTLVYWRRSLRQIARYTRRYNVGGKISVVANRAYREFA